MIDAGRAGAAAEKLLAALAAEEAGADISPQPHKRPQQARLPSPVVDGQETQTPAQPAPEAQESALREVLARAEAADAVPAAPPPAAAAALAPGRRPGRIGASVGELRRRA